MKQLILLLALLLVFPVASADKQSKIKPINMELSGSLIHLDEGGLFDINLKGKSGSANGRGLAITGAPVMYADLPADNACADLDPDPLDPQIPSGVLIPKAQMTLTFKDGSMVWGDAAPGGYVCFSGFAYAPYVIMGGFKKYEGATGWVVFEIDTHRFPTSYLVTPETGIATGEIILP